MAQELRHESLTGTTDDANVGEDADAEFRNDSSVTLFIRGVDYSHEVRTAANDEFARVEISKAPSYQG